MVSAGDVRAGVCGGQRRRRSCGALRPLRVGVGVGVGAAHKAHVIAARGAKQCHRGVRRLARCEVHIPKVDGRAVIRTHIAMRADKAAEFDELL